jgi:hypothetical protein
MIFRALIRASIPLLLLAAAGAAAAIQVPLVDALGHYDTEPAGTAERMVTIDLSGLGMGAGSLAVDFVGTVQPGVLVICGDPDPGNGSPWPGGIQVFLEDPLGGIWEGLAEMLEGEVSGSIDFRYYGSGAGDLGFLFEGPVDVHVVFFGQPFIGILCPLDYPMLDLAEATLTVNGVIGVEPQTWGAVKQLYR